jgi:hypothetical protein
MHPTSKKPRQWLLTVVSAGALLPACAHEPDLDDDEGSDEESRHVDAAVGVTVAPDGGEPVPDAGRWMGTVVNPIDAGLVAAPDTGTAPGTMVIPDPPLGVVVQPDAGAADAGVADAGAKDAGCKVPVVLGGIIAAPPDASCMPPYPGIIIRDVPDGD